MKARAIVSFLASTSLALVGGCTAAVSSPDGDVGSTPEAWDTESPTSEANSTHLWIVDHAISLLASRTDLPRAASFVQMLDAPSCRANWEQGLFDADFLAIYNNGISNTKPGDSTATILASGATWKSHFYDPDTGRNYEGETSPTARTQAAAFLASAVSSWNAQSHDTACYQLGLSFHYMTDATQPMHAANFTNLNRALQLHGHFETYAESIQSRYPVTDASFLSTTMTADAALVDAAHTSKALWPTLLQAFYNAYKSHGFACYAAYETWVTDDASCWRGNAGVDAQTALDLQSAQRSTANYLYAVSASFF